MCATKHEVGWGELVHLMVIGVCAEPRDGASFSERAGVAQGIDAFSNGELAVVVVLGDPLLTAKLRRELLAPLQLFDLGSQVTVREANRLLPEKPSNSCHLRSTIRRRYKEPL